MLWGVALTHTFLLSSLVTLCILTRLSCRQNCTQVCTHTHTQTHTDSEKKIINVIFVSYKPHITLSNLENLRHFHVWLAHKQSNDITESEANTFFLNHIWFCWTGLLVLYLASKNTHAYKHTCTHYSEPAGKNLIKVMQYAVHTRGVSYTCCLEGQLWP